MGNQHVVTAHCVHDSSKDFRVEGETLALAICRAIAMAGDTEKPGG